MQILKHFYEDQISVDANTMCSGPPALWQKAHGPLLFLSCILSDTNPSWIFFSCVSLQLRKLRYSGIRGVPQVTCHSCLPSVTTSPRDKPQLGGQPWAGDIPQQQWPSGWLPVGEVRLHSAVKAPRGLPRHRAIKADGTLVLSVGHYGKQNIQ